MSLEHLVVSECTKVLKNISKHYINKVVMKGYRSHVKLTNGPQRYPFPSPGTWKCYSVRKMAQAEVFGKEDSLITQLTPKYIHM